MTKKNENPKDFKTGTELVEQTCRNNHPMCRNTTFKFFIDGAGLIIAKCTKCGHEEFVGERGQFKGL